MHFTLKAQRVSIEGLRTEVGLLPLTAVRSRRPHHSPLIVAYVTPSNSSAPSGDAKGLGFGAVEGDRAEDEESGPGEGRK
ncbi:hypothetical protein U1Q18_037430 [Sarracenia purpurea var. burkii]